MPRTRCSNVGTLIWRPSSGGFRLRRERFVSGFAPANKENDDMDAVEALTTRASAMKLTTPAPSNEALDAIMASAMRAADHGLMKPWRFLVVEGEARNRLGALMADALKKRAPDAGDEDLERERAKPLRAPLVVVVAAAIRENPKVPDIEQIICVGAAAQNMMVAAHAMGYGGFWRTGAPAYDSAIKEGLGLAAADSIVGFMYFGTPDGLQLTI